jgi:hypothetical protein
MVVVMKNPRIKREGVTARTRYKLQVIGTAIDAGRAAWQGLCYQRHRGPPLQKTQGWGSHVSLWEKKNRASEKRGPSPLPTIFPEEYYPVSSLTPQPTLPRIQISGGGTLI